MYKLEHQIVVSLFGHTDQNSLNLNIFKIEYLFITANMLKHLLLFLLSKTFFYYYLLYIYIYICKYLFLFFNFYLSRGIILSK